MRHDGRALRGVVLAVVLAGLLAPIAAGLAVTARAAFGHLPAIGASGFSATPWAMLSDLPGFGTSLRLTLVTGLGATILSLLIAGGAVAVLYGRWGASSGRMLTPILAAPHAALAIGLAFLLAPSGWIARLLSPWATGWDRPPDLATVNDRGGFALILGLLVKEVPFLILVMLAALSQIPARAQLAAGRSLGYGPGVVWLKVILPQVYPLVRLPVYVVLAYALSVVDVALILGPSNPPTLAVAVTRWFTAPDTALMLPASAGALLIGLVVAGTIALWWVAERVAMRLGRRWLAAGGRGMSTGPGLRLAFAAWAGLMALALLAVIALALWSVAQRWSFPGALPESWSLRFWMDARWVGVAGTTLWLGLLSTGLSVILAIAWLEAETRGAKARAKWAEGLIVLPLLVPQIAFVQGLTVAFLTLGLGAGMLAVLWAQVLFVFPYVMIALSDPWRGVDPRALRAAAALGAGPWRRLFMVRLPLLTRPLLTAAAIGFAVSVALYLPTLFLGAGRVPTLTTEAVALSSGSDRRITGVFALLQAFLPFGAYAMALALPALLFRNRRGMA